MCCIVAAHLAAHIFQLPLRTESPWFLCKTMQTSNAVTRNKEHAKVRGATWQQQITHDFPKQQVLSEEWILAPPKRRA